MDVGKGVENHLRAREARQEMDMGTDCHLEEELERHAVHMRRRQHGHDFRALMHLGLGDGGKLHV